MAIERAGVPEAYGVVASISGAGVSIWTDHGLDPGRAVGLRLSFPRGSQPLLADGVVVWGDAGGGSRRFGLRWTDQSEARRARIGRLLSPSA